MRITRKPENASGYATYSEACGAATPYENANPGIQAQIIRYDGKYRVKLIKVVGYLDMEQ